MIGFCLKVNVLIGTATGHVKYLLHSPHTDAAAVESGMQNLVITFTANGPNTIYMTLSHTILVFSPCGGYPRVHGPGQETTGRIGYPKVT